MSMQVILSQCEVDTLLQAFPQGAIALDMETTGLSPLNDKIIELGAIKINRKGREDYFKQLINPGRPIPELTTKIHGITDSMVATAPPLEMVLPGFLTFIEDLPIIAHNAKFDVGLLIYALYQYKITPPKTEIYCSCKFSRFNFKKFANHRLATLVKELDISLKNHHRAFDDAVACLQVFIKGLNVYKTTNKHQITTKLQGETLIEAYLFNLKDFSYENVMNIPKHLGIIVDNLATQTPLEMKYKGGRHKNKWRSFRPISFLPMPHGNILYAHCLISDQYKMFALHKIQEVRTLNP